MNPITFIGGGNMARSLIGGLIQAGSIEPAAIHVAEPDAAARTDLEASFGVTTHADNHQAVDGVDTVVLAVKPQILPDVCRDLGSTLAGAQPLLVSIAAGIRTDQVEKWLGNEAAVVRVMPNTPALIGAGANGLHANARVDAAQRERAEAIVNASGTCAWVDDETLMDTVTAISGSAPAYFFLMVEALEDAAAANGLDRTAARQLAAQTCLGAGRMMQEGDASPAELRRRVTSPGGTTQAALNSLNGDDLPGIVARAVDAARARGAELAADND